MQTPGSPIRLLVLDVDGVLTDGRLYYGRGGEVAKAFHVRDGYGLRRALDAGLQIAVISGRPSEGAAQRLRELGIRHVFLDCREKRKTLTRLQEELNIESAATAVMGDDIPDLEMMGLAGLKIAVKDAHPDILRQADFITTLKGGRGAVREVCDALLADAAPAS
jgi:3-deoxy-D-manno-octulosonate 8-phosphate phosphatase (KDO 8-P phosphatase)